MDRYSAVDAARSVDQFNSRGVPEQSVKCLLAVPLIVLHLILTNSLKNGDEHLVC